MHAVDFRYNQRSYLVTSVSEKTNTVVQASSSLAAVARGARTLGCLDGGNNVAANLLETMLPYYEGWMQKFPRITMGKLDRQITNRLQNVVGHGEALRV